MFDWEDMEISGLTSFAYYGVKLKKKIGAYRTGTKLEMADVDYEMGTLTLWHEDGSSTFDLELRVKK